MTAACIPASSGSSDRVGLYVHIPFCRSRCAYCAFCSSIYDEDLADAYLAALIRELLLRGGTPDGFRTSTVFVGGGTPSVFSTRQLATLLAALPLSDVAEATVELNPDSVNSEKLDVLREYGVNRCSFGVQTFSASGLRLLGRRHGADAALSRVGEALVRGFASVSLDLMTAWPGQTPDELRHDLETAVSLGVTHISCYNIMREQGTRYNRLVSEGAVVEKEDEEVALFWEMTEEILGCAGFVHYETSNFCKPGFECRHNVDVWKGKEYLGVGVAAHSHIAGRRFSNTDSVEEYINTLSAGEFPEVFSERLTAEDKARECAVFWLRLFEGIDVAEFRERTGMEVGEILGEEGARLLASGCLEYSRDRKKLFVPKKYQPILDSILIDLV